MVHENRFDAILMDIDLPDRSGLEVIADLTAEDSRIRILALSGLPEDEFGRRALTAGASGYVEKNARNEEIIAAIQRVVQGKKHVSPDLASKLLDRPIKAHASDHDLLSAREFEVLRSMGKGRTLSEIANELGLSVKTASTYRTRILKKLGLKTTGEIVRYAVQKRLV
jgi:DNA-binding NarL/FixJ family response regulator